MELFSIRIQRTFQLVSTIEEDMQQPGFGSYKEIYLFYMEKLKTVRQQRYPKIVKPDWDI